MVAFFTTMLDGWNVFLQACSRVWSSSTRATPTAQPGAGSSRRPASALRALCLIIAGVYHDEYSREDSSWRIARRRYDPLLRNTGGTVTTLPFPNDVPLIG